MNKRHEKVKIPAADNALRRQLLSMYRIIHFCPKVRIVASTYKYLNAADSREMAQSMRNAGVPGRQLRCEKSDFYNDDYDGYSISFYIPDGEILAAYDKDGKLLHTTEKFKNTRLPAVIRDAVVQCLQNWLILNDIYQMHYYGQKESADKVFKLLLESGDKRIKVKLNKKEEFLLT